MDSSPPGSPDASRPEDTPTEPRGVGLWILTAFLLVCPILYLVTRTVGGHWLNFGSTRTWDAFVYLAIAPLVGTLMARRHERARFSVYVFLSCEILRAARIGSPPLAGLSLAALGYLQLPSARRVHPSISPRRVLERLGVARRSDGR